MPVGTSAVVHVVEQNSPRALDANVSAAKMEDFEYIEIKLVELRECPEPATQD